MFPIKSRKTLIALTVFFSATSLLGALAFLGVLLELDSSSEDLWIEILTLILCTTPVIALYVCLSHQKLHKYTQTTNDISETFE